MKDVSNRQLETADAIEKAAFEMWIVTAIIIVIALFKPAQMAVIAVIAASVETGISVIYWLYCQRIGRAGGPVAHIAAGLLLAFSIAWLLVSR